ncbi:MAG: hypothetical protein ACT4P1_13165 [Sporichthyaceae bacterium]
MSPKRDELARLVQEIPEDQVPAVLAEVQRRLEPAPEPTQWPPAWFGMAEGDGTSIGARSKELLADGFGR